jgi:asparagine synthase (glutamine-hydrolysing)
MFLSGGIDSSAIAAVMSKMVSDPIKTFSMAFDVPEANELSYARQVAKAMNTDHHEVMVAPSDFMAALPHLVWHEDEPIAHSASVALYFVSQLAQRYVKVVLTGEGSDELLAGYYRYRTTLLNLSAGSGYHAMTSESVRGLIRGALGRVAPNGLHNKLQRTFLWRNPNVDELYFDNFAVFPRAAQAALLSDQLKSELVGIDPYVGMNGFFSSAGGDPSLLQRLLYTDIKTYLHELLMKQDQMSMAASIESRVPFLDHKLVEHSAMLPDRMKLRGWTTKWILREAMQGVLPDTILKRPKMGFPVPLPRWLRGEFQWLLDEYVTSDRALGRGLFNESAVRQLVVEHKSVSKNHADKLWLLINLEIWQRIFIDGELPQGALPQLQEAKQ